MKRLCGILAGAMVPILIGGCGASKVLSKAIYGEERPDASVVGSAYDKDTRMAVRELAKECEGGPGTGILERYKYVNRKKLMLDIMKNRGDPNYVTEVKKFFHECREEGWYYIKEDVKGE